MLVSDFHFQLPEELIAQQPLASRDASRMLHLVRSPQGVQGSTMQGSNLNDRTFRDFPTLLRSGDLLVFNNSRVFPARLYGHRQGARPQPPSPQSPASPDPLQGRIEVFLTRQLSQQPNDWECLVRPGRKIAVGERLSFFSDRAGQPPELQAEILARGEFGERRIRFHPVPNFFAVLDRIGHVPLPPYIVRADSTSDRDRYQTVYAQPPGSIAAPTAGLHFTPAILQQIRDRGIESVEVTLHVGLGTFQPVRAERVEDHKIHAEPYSISPPAAAALNRALQEGRRIVAVGTTTVRTLEHAIRSSPAGIAAGSAIAGIFIYPGFEFKAVRALLTNFHLPQSSLLMLVSAFAGKETVLRAYRHAVSQRYRFYSYGDCMLIE